MILLRKRPDGFVGAVTIPSARTQWIFDQPISEAVFRERMAEIGAHSTDVWDVISEADRTGFAYL